MEFCADLDAALPAVDLAVVVAEPDPAKAALLQPTLRQLERMGVPHALFINKMDQARGSLPELLAALAPVSTAPLVARQIPRGAAGRITATSNSPRSAASAFGPGRARTQGGSPRP